VSKGNILGDRGYEAIAVELDRLEKTLGLMAAPVDDATLHRRS
jgi:hypothetical protein